MSGSGAVCLFSHYDPAGRVRPHVRALLRALADCGYAVHGAGAADGDAGAEPPPPGVASWRGRLNAGFDFGAWRDLLAEGCADGARTVLLANDSVLGPLFSLRPVVERMEAQALDAWSLVESREGGWHLQSWFLQLTADALNRPAVRRVFDQPFERMSKREVVARGEMALAAAFRAEGLRCGAAVSVRGPSWLRPVNPMLFSPRAVLRAGVPFVKAELLRANPAGIGWAADWRRWAASEAFPAAWIEEAVRARAGGAADAPHPTPAGAAGLERRLEHLLLSQDRGDALQSVFAPRRRP